MTRVLASAFSGPNSSVDDVLAPVIAANAAWFHALGNVSTIRVLEARVRIELTIEVLQTSALPLGYRALKLS